MSLPERTTKFRFPKFPSFHDPEYDPANPNHFFRAWEQAARESMVINAEFRELQNELRLCVASNAQNALELCRPLSLEYYRRSKCPNYVCEDHPRYRPPVNVLDYKFVFSEPDNYLELRWKKYNLKAYD